MKEKLERWIEFSPAWDKRDSNPGKNYGIHCAEMCWYVRGDKGVVQFVVFTEWYLPGTNSQGDFGKPFAADLGYHSLVPQYDGQTPQDNCRLLHGKPCYYDGSGLAAQDVFKLLIAKGHEAVWKKLEDHYYAIFEGACEV